MPRYAAAGAVASIVVAAVAAAVVVVLDIPAGSVSAEGFRRLDKV